MNDNSHTNGHLPARLTPGGPLPAEVLAATFPGLSGGLYLISHPDTRDHPGGYKLLASEVLRAYRALKGDEATLSLIDDLRATVGDGT